MLTDPPNSTRIPVIRAIRFLHFYPLFYLLPMALCYLSGNLYAPMLLIDEAQQADYVSRVVSGSFPYRDFLDIYGPLNWFPPAFFYRLFGEAWFGVRLFMVLVILGILVFVYEIVRHAGSRFYAIWSFLLCLVFLGTPLNIHMTPYAFMQLYPLILGTIFFLSVRRKKQRAGSLMAAGLLSGAALFFKISSGLFLFLAGLLLCFCHQGDMPVYGACSHEGARKSIISRCVIGSKWMALSLYFLVFTSYIFPHYEKQYFFHLTLPTLLAFGLLAAMEQGRFSLLPNETYLEKEIYRIRHFALFLLAGLITAFLLYLLFLPSGISQAMIATLPDILKEAEYFMPFAPLFSMPDSPVLAILVKGGWFMLSWAGSLLFGVILFVFLINREAGGGGTNLFATRQAQDLMRWVGIFLVAALSHYVIYPTPDTGHLIQSLILWILVMGMGLFLLEDFLRFSGRKKSLYRAAVVLVSIGWCAPLVTAMIPAAKAAFPRAGEIAPLSEGEYVLEMLQSIDDQEYHRHLAEIAAFIKKRLHPEDEIFTLSGEKQINLYAGRPLYGGRDAFLVYLVSHDRLSRKSFDRLALPQTVENLKTHPPRFIVNHDYNGGQATRAVFPEIDRLLSSRYKKVFTRKQIIVYERID
jgi:hypothetical protein